MKLKKLLVKGIKVFVTVLILCFIYSFSLKTYAQGLVLIRNSHWAQPEK